MLICPLGTPNNVRTIVSFKETVVVLERCNSVFTFAIEIGPDAGSVIAAP
jgi:hypothetical protein